MKASSKFKHAINDKFMDVLYPIQRFPERRIGEESQHNRERVHFRDIKILKHLEHR